MSDVIPAPANSGRARGHGKIILLGEHAVVYGKPAIAAGMSLGCEAHAEASAVDSLSVEPWGVRVEAKRHEADEAAEHLRQAFEILCERYGSERPKLHVRAHMQIPGGAGLGGSAALSIAVLRAMDAFLGRTSNADELLEASLAWERVFHGNPSGIDSAMAIRGGLAWYTRGAALAPIRLGRTLHLVVGHSGQPGKTAETVKLIADQRDKNPKKIDDTMAAIQELVTNAKSALELGDHKNLGQLMDLNQTLLAALLVSTSRLEEMCKAARAAGALGAKLTGGGGGGCMIALAAGKGADAPITAALRALNYGDTFSVEVTL